MSPIIFNNLMKNIFEFDYDACKSDVFSLSFLFLESLEDVKKLQDLYSFEYDKFMLEELR